MNIKFFAPEWGNTIPFKLFAQRVKEEGYDGVEMALPFEEKDKREILSILKDFDLQLIGQYYQSFEKNINEHLKNYEKYLRHLAYAEPVFINCQTGKDYFSFEQNNQLFDLAYRVSKETGVKITHETHRGKCLFAAHITRDYLSKIPGLRICLDISHWCAVHESLLEDQEEAIDLAISHTDHIHSRVGFQEGPQVSDPRAKENNDAFNAHLGWWDKVIAMHKENDTNLTITTEFGPYPYMPALPFTQMPIANQWEINVYMMNLLKARAGGKAKQ